MKAKENISSLSLFLSLAVLLLHVLFPLSYPDYQSRSALDFSWATSLSLNLHAS